MSLTTRKASTLLWVTQGILAALFLFAGVMKLVMPLEALEGPVALPGWFLRFIGVAETLGALGLILPGLFRIQPVLTTYAAVGLLLIMSGATSLTLLSGMVGGAVLPAIAGILAATVAYGRKEVAPYHSRSRQLVAA